VQWLGYATPAERGGAHEMVPSKQDHDT
jgi:hypothetical protein